MPIITKIDQERNRVLASVVGPLTMTDIEEHLKLERHFEGIAYPELVDARAARINFTPQEVRQIVALIRTMNDGQPFGPTAVLVSTDVEFGILRMAEMLLEDVCQIEPFRNMSDALSWLGWDDAPQSNFSEARPD